MQIEDLFCSREISLELMNLGFNENCLAGYPLAGNFQLGTRENIEKQLMKNAFKNEHLCIYDCMAPTYEQAFSWIRQRYNCDAYISEYLRDKFYWRVRLNYIDKVKGYSNFSNSYAEAREECLKKLLEIIKKRKE